MGRLRDIYCKCLEIKWWYYKEARLLTRPCLDYHPIPQDGSGLELVESGSSRNHFHWRIGRMLRHSCAVNQQRSTAYGHTWKGSSVATNISHELRKVWPLSFQFQYLTKYHSALLKQLNWVICVAFLMKLGKKRAEYFDKLTPKTLYMTSACANIWRQFPHKPSETRYRFTAHCTRFLHRWSQSWFTP